MKLWEIREILKKERKARRILVKLEKIDKKISRIEEEMRRLEVGNGEDAKVPEVPEDVPQRGELEENLPSLHRQEQGRTEPNPCREIR